MHLNLAHQALDTLSRLKGIETVISDLSILQTITLDTLSRLKGIETDTSRDQEEN